MYLEVANTVPAEVVVLDTLGGQVSNNHGGQANSVGGLLGVLNLGKLLRVLLHHIHHGLLGLLEDIGEENDSSLTSGHSLHHTKVDVLNLVGVLLASEVEDLEELLEVEILLHGDDVEHLLEVIFAVTRCGSGNITGNVQCGTI